MINRRILAPQTYMFNRDNKKTAQLRGKTGLSCGSQSAGDGEHSKRIKCPVSKITVIPDMQTGQRPLLTSKILWNRSVSGFL